MTDRKRKAEWAEFIKEIVDEHYPKADKTASALYEVYKPSEAKGSVTDLPLPTHQSTEAG